MAENFYQICEIQENSDQYWKVQLHAYDTLRKDIARRKEIIWNKLRKEVLEIAKGANNR